MADDQGTETVTTETTEAPADVVVVAATETTTEGGDPADGATVLGGEEEAAAKVETVVPEAYELTAPEGLTLDAESLEAATPVFKELGLSNEQADKLMPVAAEFAKRAAAGAIAEHTLAQAGAFQAQTREWLENAKGDAEIGGVNWDKSVTLSAKALDMLGAPKGSAFRTLLNETGLGNHPDMIRMFARIGSSVSEDSFARTEGRGATPKPTEEILYPNMTKAGE